MFAASSSGLDQIPSMLSIQGMLRSPKAVASGATRVIAPANRQTDVYVISEGRAIASGDAILDHRLHRVP